MNCITIPTAVLESPEYANLTLGDRMFLIDLYVVFNDVERFTIDISTPEEYRQSKGVWLPPRIRRLLQSGFIVEDGRHKKGRDHYLRIFRFRHPPFEVEKAA